VVRIKRSRRQKVVGCGEGDASVVGSKGRVDPRDIRPMHTHIPNHEISLWKISRLHSNGQNILYGYERRTTLCAGRQEILIESSVF
jgi:hypothetical protein